MPDDYAGNSSTTGSLTAGSSVSGSIETGGDEDWFAISLVAGQRYTFNLNGASTGGLSDTYLTLYNSAGTVLTYNDDTSGLNSQIIYSATSSGTYYLGARGYSSYTGAYTLTSSAGSLVDDYAGDTSTTGALVAGSSVNGSIETANDNDWFAISLVAGQSYTFNLNGTSVGGLRDPYLVLFNNSGVALASNDDYSGLNSQITYTPTSSGTYYLGARSINSDTGAYTLTSSVGSSADDYAASTSTSGVIVPGGSTSGRIETASDHDWFAISLVAGQSYTFNLNGASTGGLSDTYLTLRNSAGTALASNDDYSGLNSQIIYTPTSSGTYYLDASGYSSYTGAYTLTSSGGSGTDDYAASTSTSGIIVPGGSASGRIETASDHDWFAISLAAGQSYTFNLNGASTGGLSDTYLTLRNSAGTVLASNDDYSGLNSQITYTAASSGTYYLDASGYSSYTGAYTLTSSGGSSADDYAASASTSGIIVPGGSASGRIETASDHDWFAISLAAGQRYTFNLNGASTGGLSDTYLTLRNSAGTVLASNDDYSGLNSQIIYTATSSGTYYLDASGYGSNTGSYTLTSTGGATTDDYVGSSATTGTVAVGGQVKGNVETSGDHDWFAVTLNAGHRYTFNLDPDTVNGLSDPYLRLYSGNGTTLLASDDDSGPGYGAQIIYTATSSGTYYLDAAGYGSGYTGSYALTVTGSTTTDDYAGSTATTGSLSPGSSVAGQIETSGDSDWFAITLAAGQRYTFNLNSGSGTALSDPYLTLYNSSGTVLAANDDYNGRASQIVFTASTGGTYYLGASGYGGLTGSYTLTSSAGTSTDDYPASTSTSGVLTPGGSATGNIETGSDADWFAISLAAGQRYTFTLDAGSSSGLSDPMLRLYNNAGSLLVSDDDSGTGLGSLIVYTASSAGTYYLGASGAFSSLTGSYVLHSSTGTATDDYAGDTSTSGRVTAGSSVTGQIERSGDTDWFGITLTAGQRYTFDLNPASSNGLSDPYLNLYNGSGTLLASNDDTHGLASEIVYTPASSGTYYLGARAYSSQTGAYTLSAVGATTTTDDFAANTTTTGRLTLGSSATGQIETANDNDWFAVTLAAGQSYVFDLSPAASGGLGDPYLTLYNSSGTALASNDDSNGTYASQISYTASTAGTYYLGARGYGTATGSYQLSASTVGQTTPGYSIDVVFSGSSQYQSYFTVAAQQWATVITGDLPNVGSIDDLQISASVTDIDGVGGTLGQAAARGTRSEGGLPYSGFMQFDQADVDSMIDKGIFGAVVLHEMGHVLGFSGYFFNQDGLLNPDNAYQYIGSHALQQYRSLTSSSNTYVPIEQGGGSGTRGSHWTEDIFNTELMTGWAENSPPMPISIVTIGALQDLGYTVNYAAADSFSF